MLWVIIANLAALSALMYLIQEITEVEGKEGFMYSVYPWINTFPETLSTALLLISGYPTAALYNSIFSAAFDAAAGLGLAAIVHGTVTFAATDLSLITVIAAVTFMVLDFDGLVSVYDSVLLFILLLFATLYSILRYGMFKRKLSAFDIGKTVMGLGALAVVTLVYYQNVEMLIPFVGEKIGGVISAALTSLPDLITAIVYGLTSPESQAELLGCIAHDFIENVPTSVLAAAFVAGSAGMIDIDPMRTLIVTGLTAASLLFVASYKRITRFEGALLVTVFIIAAALAIV